MRGLKEQRGFVATFDVGTVLLFDVLGVSAKHESVRRKKTKPLEDLHALPVRSQIEIKVICHLITCLLESTAKVIHVLPAVEFWKLCRTFYFFAFFFVFEASSSHQSLGFNNLLMFPE